MKIIKTDRLILRNWRDCDLEPFITMNSDDDVMQFFPNILTPKETLEFINRIKNHFIKHGFGLMAVELKSNQEFIGFIGLHHPVFMQGVEIAWRIAKKYWGQGLASEGAAAVLNYGFSQLNLEEIISFTTKINTKSIRVMERIGMKHDKNRDFSHPLLASNHKLSKHFLYFAKNNFHDKKNF